MPVLRVKATELVNTDVEFVSLVQRGANRIPFRIVKQEDEGMLDLQLVGRQLFAKAEQAPAADAVEAATAPEVVAAIVPSGADLEKVAALFKEAGLDADALVKSEGDGFVTFAKTGADKADDAVVIKTGDKIALVVSGVRKAFDAYTGTTGFTDAVKAQTFYASYWTAKDVLSDAIASAIQAAATPAQAESTVSAIIDEFKAYVTTLLSALPAAAFYVDRGVSSLDYYAPVPVLGCDGDAGGEDDGVDVDITIINKGEGCASSKDKKEAAASDAPNEPSAVSKAAPAASEGDSASAADATGDPAGESGGGEKEPSSATKDEASTAGSVQLIAQEPAAAGTDEPGMPELLAGLQKSQADALSAAMEGIQKSLTAAVGGLADEVRKQVAALSERIDHVDQQVQKADAAINGTVFAESRGDAQKRARKGETTSIPPLLDTAFERVR